MIRRPPTTIPLTDLDVAQVRLMVQRQKLEKLRDQAIEAEKKGLKLDIDQMGDLMAGPAYHHPDESRKKREGMTREERLGLSRMR
ncbi:uncharacterized protein BXZ73DRAFT_47481 [Epithele typhae]|uniref:uncharacterized protein n=1 Tax=Epithele typhae TaxID=378194 RepID=UPI002007872D|nr:uncharacterized protein BXZ73DRAFT_47481 [Epithele typhae]KAH9931073.1 hypothetical protein BXZ73DRAFT_47481 [Epithele typhae]